MTLQHDGHITIETHHKHADQMCSLLALNRKLQVKKTPGHADADQVDVTGDFPRNLQRHSEHVFAFFCTLMQTFHIASAFCTLTAQLQEAYFNNKVNVEPDAEPEAIGDPLDNDNSLLAAETMNATAPQLPRKGPTPTAEDCMRWMLERCSTRRDSATSQNRRRLYEERLTVLQGLLSAMRSPVDSLSATSQNRRRLYEERLTVLQGLLSAMRSPVDSLRVAALRTIASMSDISDDEDCPSYAAIHGPASLGHAQRALDFIRSL
eukprot:s843_g2.t1